MSVNLENRREKIFRDTVHGYIHIPIDYVENFIDTELFQRLRNIEQTGMRALYPSARHDRFVHSLGVYHLGHKAFLCFKKNVAQQYGETHYRVFKDDEKTERFWNRCQVLFEIACLLHDCGHAPFSHTLEFFYTNDGALRNQKMREYFPSERFKEDFSKGPGAPHELMSALLVKAEYEGAVKSLISKYALGESGVSDEEWLEFVARMIIGCPYDSGEPQYLIRNCLISLLNSTTIDVDSLDYIVRDAAMSGIDNMSIDINRLLSSLTLVEISVFSEVQFRGTTITAAVLKEDNPSPGELECPPPQLKPLNRRCSFIGKLDGSLDAAHYRATIERGTVELEGHLKTLNYPELRDAEQVPKYISSNGAEYAALPQSVVQSDMTICGKLTNELEMEGSSLSFKDRTNAQIKIETDPGGSIMFNHAYMNGQLHGIFSGMLLGNYQSIGGTLRLALGFHKSSLSVIQNVVIARNYEYQWIYSHHKVVYYANYLLIELLRMGVRYLLNQRKPESPHSVGSAIDSITSFLSWKAMVDPGKQDDDCGPQEALGMQFWRPTDADILALFKQCQIQLRLNPPADSGSRANEDFEDLMRQYATRNYRTSLWKSYAEMRNFLSEFTEDDISEIQEMLVNEAPKETTDEKPRLKTQFGYLSEDWVRKFHSFGMDDVVWIDGKSKMKHMDPNKTYIRFKDRSMTYGDVSSLNRTNPGQISNLFYLYYRPVPGMEVKKNDLISFLRSELNSRPRRS